MFSFNNSIQNLKNYQVEYVRLPLSRTEIYTGSVFCHYPLIQHSKNFEKLSHDDNGLKQVAVAVADCAGHPRSLNRLHQIICLDTKQTVWYWIDLLLIDLNLPPISPKEFVLLSCVFNKHNSF